MSKTPWMIIPIMLALLLFFIPGYAKGEDTIFPDSNLEAAVRLELNLLEKPLEETDLERLTSLYPQDPSKKMNSIEGLQYAKNLSSLIIPGHDVQQLEPLKNLSKLSFLVLDGNNITDIEPLQNNINLSRLLLSGNNIENIEPLSHLQKLTDLLMSNNRVKDISALKGLPLQWLTLSNNQIEDLTPLQYVPSLETLYLEQNNIRNIDVLLELPNLREVHLENNPLDKSTATVIHALKEKGVIVQTVQEETADTGDIRVNLDANPVSFNSPPFIKDSTTLVPFRPIFDRLGLQITWDETDQTITGKKRRYTNTFAN